MGANADPALMRDLNFDMFTRILPYAKQYGVKVPVRPSEMPPV